MFKKMRILLAFLLIIPLSSCSIGGLGGLPAKDFFNICVRNLSEMKIYGIGLRINLNGELKQSQMAQNADNTQLSNDYINFSFRDVPMNEEHDFSFKVKVMDENETNHLVDDLVRLELESEKAYYYSIVGNSFETLKLVADPEPTPPPAK